MKVNGYNYPDSVPLLRVTKTHVPDVIPVGTIVIGVNIYSDSYDVIHPQLAFDDRVDHYSNLHNYGFCYLKSELEPVNDAGQDFLEGI